MVGDDFENDIEPAKQLGLHTYRITNGTRDPVSAHVGKQGTLADCLEWVLSGGLREL
jgi:FMN phosphatase YigB (HAD superfamily)